MKEFPPVPELNWCGVPIREGEGYGGRPENIPKPCGGKPGQAAAKQQHPKNQSVITLKDLALIFDSGRNRFSRAEAAKLLEHAIGSHRTSAYRSLRLDGRFSKHLYTDGTKLGWRRGP